MGQNILVLLHQEFKSDFEGGLISEFFFTLAQIFKMLHHSPEHFLFLWIVIWHLFCVDLSQSEKLVEIKPPLKRFWLCALCSKFIVQQTI